VAVEMNVVEPHVAMTTIADVVAKFPQCENLGIL
jgi:hypothetical protein